MQMLKSLLRLHQIRHRTGRKRKKRRTIKKNSFPKESVENADLPCINPC